MVDLVFLSWFILIPYLLFGIGAIYGFMKQTQNAALAPIPDHSLTNVTVIIPCRNESEVISRLLTQLKAHRNTLPGLQVLVIDDHSEDQTLEIISAFHDFQSFTLPDDKSGKKAAITFGVEKSSHDIILCLDADVNLPKDFSFQKISAFFQEKSDVHLLVFPIKIIPKNRFFGLIHLLEHFALSTYLISFSSMGFPFLAHGACMAFRREKFIQVDGFEGNLEISSGDDTFLLEKIKKLNQNAVSAATDLFAPVETNSVSTFKQFLAQRIRWASKFNKGERGLNFCLAIIIGLTNIWMLFSTILVFINVVPLKTYFIQLGIKFLIDFLLLILSANYFRQKRYLTGFPIFYWFYPLLAVWIIFAVFFVPVKWKGRKIK